MEEEFQGFIPPKDWVRRADGSAHLNSGQMFSDDEKFKKKKAVLNKQCWVCGAPAAEHVHYGAICCYSCRAFFRRSGARNYQCIRGDFQCEVNTKFRKYCKKCRYKKCLDSGMKPELVDASLRNREADIKSVKGQTVAYQDDASQDFNEVKVPICEAETSKHASSVIEKLAPRQSLGSAPQAWPKMEEQPFIKGSVGLFDLPPSKRKSNFHAPTGGLRFKQVSTIQTNNKIIQREELYNSAELQLKKDLIRYKKEKLEEEERALWAEQKSTNRDRSGFFSPVGIEQFGGGIGGDIGDNIGGSIGCGIGVDWSGKGGVMYPGEGGGIGYDAGFGGYGDRGRFGGDGGMLGGDGRSFGGYGGRFGPNKDEMYNRGKEYGIFNPQMVEYEKRKYMNETNIYRPIHTVYTLKDINEEEMMVDEEDCKTGLCEIFDGVSTLSPAYQPISKNIFNVSSIIETQNQRISVIQGPRKPTAEDLKKPLKKRTCTKMCKSFYRKFLYCEPIIKLTWEEKNFIDKRVVETRRLVAMVQGNPTMQEGYGLDEFKEERKSAVKSFSSNFEPIFGKLRSKNMSEIKSMGLMESRFLCCALTSIAVRLFGGSRDGAMITPEYTSKYAGMLRTPWACSYEEEEKVVGTLRKLGELIGSDEKLEVLFTTCIMRGFQDPRSAFMQLERGNTHTDDSGKDKAPEESLEDEPGHPAKHKPAPEEAR
ncbi:uncharacterized protein LOC111707447 [Eurytemora carolleeae]|uniref:uncharacterized protein LOC111707447 n=1 Tax=Eurytemora carolleeae TaxID=1294199 RepID=UPI000C784045|nr:uncharacterized protein LOC111707447 [Eurytemora carolleeae]|eukprot:XP_023336326.1 uncharacterized protein LOC111707447 [Eurytemora affinis]